MEDIFCRGELYGKLMLAKAWVDPDEYPQMCEVFGDVIAEDADIEEIDYVKVADALSECDHGKVIPEGVANFITEVYEVAIDEGDGRAANNLGSMYYLGRFGKKDYAKAIEYYKKAIELNYELAFDNIAYCYYYGQGAEQNYEEAFKYFTMASLHGRYGATFKLGDMYRYGQYVEKNDHMTAICYCKAFDLIKNENTETNPHWGSVLRRVADLFYEGIDLDKDPMRALDFYQQAERGYYIQIGKGDQYSNDSLKMVIERQKKLRKIISGMLPVYEYDDEARAKDRFVASGKGIEVIPPPKRKEE